MSSCQAHILRRLLKLSDLIALRNLISSFCPAMAATMLQVMSNKELWCWLGGWPLPAKPLSHIYLARLFLCNRTLKERNDFHLMCLRGQYHVDWCFWDPRDDSDSDHSCMSEVSIEYDFWSSYDPSEYGD